MQSGEDNNVALTNDPNDRNATLGADLCTFQLREYKAMARLAEMLGKKTEAAEYRQKTDQLRSAMLKHLWFAQEKMFFNVRRDTGKPVHHISGSNFIPLIEEILPRDDARAMIRQYLWNPDHKLAPHGIRSLSKQDPSYNNVSMIEPYFNWQDQFGLTPTSSTSSPSSATAFRTKPGNSPARWAASLSRISTPGTQCTNATTETPAKDWRRPRNNPEITSSPASSAGICWCRTCCSVKLQGIVLVSTRGLRCEPK
jgi:hypothetical protein